MTHGPAHGNLVTSNIGYWVLGIGYYDLVSWYPGIPVSWLPGYLLAGGLEVPFFSCLIKELRS